MLRGPQTPGELKLRTERLHHFGSPEEVERLLEQLAGRELARSAGRRPGQKEDRWVQLLGSEEEPGAEPALSPAPSPSRSSLEDRVAALEREVAELKRRLDGD